MLKKMKWKRCLILEDDAIFNYPKERILYIITEFLQTHDKNWDVFMLSTYWTDMADTELDFIKKLIWGTTFTSYIVNEHYIDKLLCNFRESRQLLYEEVEQFKINSPNKKLRETANALDQHSQKIQRTDNWYISHPYICVQSPHLYSSTMQ